MAESYSSAAVRTPRSCPSTGALALSRSARLVAAISSASRSSLDADGSLAYGSGGRLICVELMRECRCWRSCAAGGKQH